MFSRTKTGMVVAVCALVLTVGAGVASAHDTSWYWGETTAEYRLGLKYDDISTAYCYGLGRSMRSKTGAKLYKHFYCRVSMEDSSTEYGDLHVTGKYSLRFVWDSGD